MKVKCLDCQHVKTTKSLIAFRCEGTCLKDPYKDNIRAILELRECENFSQEQEGKIKEKQAYILKTCEDLNITRRLKNATLF